jgi:hypothetical protein
MELSDILVRSRWLAIPFSFFPGLVVGAYAISEILAVTFNQCDLQFSQTGFLIFGSCINQFDLLLYLTGIFNAASTILISYLVAPEKKLKTSKYVYMFWITILSGVLLAPAVIYPETTIKQPFMVISYYISIIAPIALSGFIALQIARLIEIKKTTEPSRQAG